MWFCTGNTASFPRGVKLILEAEKGEFLETGFFARGSIDPLGSNRYKLCKACERVFTSSTILNQEPRSRFIWHFFRTEPRRFESFEHHSNAAELERAASEGCHFCNMVWTSMTLGQRKFLLKGEKRLADNFEQQTSTTEDNKESASKRELYHRQRRVRLVIQQYHKATIDPITLWHRNTSISITPHFGTKRARRWMKCGVEWVPNLVTPTIEYTDAFLVASPRKEREWLHRSVLTFTDH